MKPNVRQRRIFAWSAPFGVAVIAITFTGSGFAHPTKKAATGNRVVQKNTSHEKCSVVFSGNPFPQPCDRLGPIPSTASPMVIIGQAPPMRQNALGTSVNSR
jgi:hypothetical protein